jgi:hypothetical protein
VVNLLNIKINKMQLVLNNTDLEKLDGFIKKTPFEFAYPIFQFLTALIQQQAAKENVKEPTQEPKTLKKA